MKFVFLYLAGIFPYSFGVLGSDFSYVYAS